MKLHSIVRALAIPTLVAVLPALAADIVLTPPAGGGVSVTNAGGTVTQLRVADDGTTLNGNLSLVTSTAGAGNVLKGASPFIHNFGTSNTFVGVNAGNFTLTGGSFNTASGENSLRNISTGVGNTASGWNALRGITTADNNTAFGVNALMNNIIGENNTAVGLNALINTTGNGNIALGISAGNSLTSGSNNIVIGHPGVAAESGTIRIGNPATHTSMYLAGNVTVDPAKVVNFGSTTRQMLNLWSTTYGIGIQDSTEYFRTGYAYAWHRGGVHSDAQFAPGAGGETLMVLFPAAVPPVLPAVTGHLRVQVLTQTSDRAAKEAFAEVDGRQVLAALVGMPLHTWKYRNEDAAVRHIGPTAQDFRANFGMGYDDKTIATVDADGVALAAIKGLHAVVAEKDRRIEANAARIAELEQDRKTQQARMEVLELQAVESRRETARLARLLARLDREVPVGTASR